MEDASPPPDVRPFGLELYEALKVSGRGGIVTSKLDYAGIQELKTADRKRTVELFRGSEYAALQALRKESAAEVVRMLNERAEEAARAAGANAALLIFAGVAVFT